MDSFDFGLLIPIGVCVVLPIMIVWIVFKAKTNNDNKRADVLIKAIEKAIMASDIGITQAANLCQRTIEQTAFERLHVYDFRRSILHNSLNVFCCT